MSAPILITGASGFIGERLARLFLNSGRQVISWGRSRPDIDCVHIDSAGLSEAAGSAAGLNGLTAVFDSYKPSLVINAVASFDNGDISALTEVNFELPLNLLERCAEHGSQFIQLGSYWQLGNAGKAGAPIDLYSATKAALLPLMQHYALYRGVSCLNCILYGTYGEGDKRGKVLDLIINAAQKGEPLKLSAGDQRLNLTDIDDLLHSIQVLSKSMPKGYSEAYLYAKHDYSIKELVSLVQAEKNFEAVFGAKNLRAVELSQPLYPAASSLIETTTVKDYIKSRLGQNN
ncbi:NAD-dependent epimerase/dehydratase family protein [Agaribacterium haliotis]|uniref:NAD-dependent epimerase/dehydratase family protein n=1 Tax=Agaribacterium haliotis TaxID=2013869 RepID=UPI000BB57D4F|nr:NAD-dependent epimerase/dehydratase family protein [Agaribacterium haliotis]